MHGSTLGPGIFAGLGGQHTERPTWSHLCRMGHRQGGSRSHLPQLAKQLQSQQQASLSAFWREKNKVEIHRTHGLRLLTSCLRLPSNSGPRKKMEILKVSWAPHLIFLHIGWVLDICLWSRTCTTTTKRHFSVLRQALGTVWNRKPWTCLCLYFFIFFFLPSVTTETDGYFFQGVGRAIWLQCVIVIIADSDTLLAGSSLLLRQLPFNRKGRGSRGQARLKNTKFGSLLGPGCSRSMPPPSAHEKGQKDSGWV